MSDAHTHQSQSPSQQEIIKRLPELWHEAENTRQYDMEQRFLQNFFRVQRQEYALKNNNCLLVYASSIAMVITSNYLMKKNFTVSLMHPCFDNITDILKNMKIPISPLEEDWFSNSDTIYQKLEESVHTDAMFIVEPNNPTGFALYSLGRKGWEEVIRFAKDKNKLLLIDFCFAPFLLTHTDLEIFDVYEILENSGVSYIAYEDTGKTWPLQDTKVAIIKTSKDLYPDVYNIHTSYLLNVSPFILNLVTQYILDSEKDNFASVYTLLRKNKEMAEVILEGSILSPIEPLVKVPVLWCKILNENIKATDLKEYLEKSGVHILPGTYFFWNDKEKGQHYVRIALARDADRLEAGLKALRKALNEYQPQ
jgi:aspartate/methionine/tyrosine aminotransferase